MRSSVPEREYVRVNLGLHAVTVDQQAATPKAEGLQVLGKGIIVFRLLLARVRHAEGWNDPRKGFQCQDAHTGG